MSNFGDLINIDEYWDKREQFNEDRWGIAYYCKDCKKIVEVKKVEWKKYDFSCEECSWKDVVIGTCEWLKSNYRIK
jgi:DNA-directed RNA polymerase subunit RPC12/RpoP